MRRQEPMCLSEGEGLGWKAWGRYSVGGTGGRAQYDQWVYKGFNATQGGGTLSI